MARNSDAKSSACADSSICNTDSFLLDLSLALRSPFDPGDENHESTSECLRMTPSDRSLICPDLGRLLSSPLSLSLPGRLSFTRHSCQKGIAMVQWTGHPLDHRYFPDARMFGRTVKKTSVFR